jgi:translation initiation factor IF-1
MQRFELIRLEGKISACLPGALCQVELANGHIFLARMDLQGVENSPPAAIPCLPGLKVLVELRAFDLSAGRILEILEPGFRGSVPEAGFCVPS